MYRKKERHKEKYKIQIQIEFILSGIVYRETPGTCYYFLVLFEDGDKLYESQSAQKNPSISYRKPRSPQKRIKFVAREGRRAAAGGVGKILRN